MLKATLACFAAALVCGPALASPESEAYVGGLIERLHQVDQGAEADFIVDNVDMPRVSNFVLGKYARETSGDDYKLFTARLDRFLREFLGSRSEELSSADLRILSSVDRTETDSIVTTRISSPTREPMTMRWRVLHRDGAWRLIDVEVHGLWLAIEQRAQIMALLDKQDTQIADLYFVASTD
jgi:ABC-type transporter MlaC component